MKFSKFIKVLFGVFILSGCAKKVVDGYAPDPTVKAPTALLVISPAAVTVAVTNSSTFTASGGRAPYSYSIFSGSGSVGLTTGNFIAPGVAGSTVVRVADADGRTADAVVSINSALQISPTTPSLSINGSQTFSSTGGVPPVTFSRISGTGSVDANTGVYSAPSSPGTATIRVIDSRGNTSQTTVSVFGALGISPTSTTLAVNNTATFSAAGGAGPYTYSLVSGSGIINASTGVYTAPATSGTATVRVTDSLGGTANASITINNALVISPTSQTTLINSTITFSRTGGVDPVSYSIVTGTGSINSASGVFTAPSSNGTAVVRVTDVLGNYSDANVNITTTLSISPSSTTLAVNNTATFSAVGGTGPFTFTRVSGTGSINASTGVYTAPATSGTAVVQVTDALGATANASITINSALSISPVTQSMGVGGTLSFSSAGGVLPHTFSIFSGGGSVDPNSGLFTAPGTAGTTVVRVTDSIGNRADATITVTVGLSISPASVTMAVNNTRTFTGSNGTSPYTFSLVSGSGSINATTGLYTAGATAGSAVVRVTDNVGATATASITINPALTISPTSKTLAVNNGFTFSASGGVSPYVYSIVSGGGTINSSTGAYVAPATAGTATIRVTGGSGNTADATVTINAALAISPMTAEISAVDTRSHSASGGVSPYTYSITSGPGTINASTGLYTASSAGSVIVRVTDSLGNTSSNTITVQPALTVTPVTAYVAVDSDLDITPAGGVEPYTYAIISGSGTVDSATGTYTAPATTGSAVIRTTDSMGHTADTTVTIHNPLTLSPLTITLAANGTQTFTASGGYGARTFSIVYGEGSINSSTGLYTAPATAGVAEIQVADTIGNILTAEITIVSSLTITPQTLVLPVFSTMPFTSILGTAPYVYSVPTGTGSINSSTGLYTGASTVGIGTVQVTDSVTNTSTATVTHIEPVELVSGSYHTCVRYNNNRVKCFGDGANGQLGSGSTADLGDAANEQGGLLPFVNLGTGRSVKALAAGYFHSCAIMDDDDVKCWGQNTYGQLGLGDTAHRGDGANEMGDNLPDVNLGAGRKASKLFAFGYVTCALLDDSSTKCWGRNNYGQLGQGDIVNRGTAASQMGDSLTPIDFGTGRTVVKMTGGLDFTCALLDNAKVKCFGRANNGQLGYENTVTLGDNAGEMGDSLNYVNLGTGRTVSVLASGYSHSCAVLDNNTVKCWGRNQSGQLGLGDTSNRGNGTSQMGDSLATLPFSGGFVPNQLFLGRQFSCGQSAAGAVRCWGFNSYGQLAIGSTTHRGDNPGELAALGDINFGTGPLSAVKISAGYYFGCAILSNKRIKCYGYALNGALLNASTSQHLGDTESGDTIPFVNH